MLEITLIQDLARRKLQEVPRNVLNMTNLKMLYLEGNHLEELPTELFILLDKLQWLDVRNNKLTVLPKSVMDHICLETILLQNNDIEALPLELGFIPNLKVLQLSGNPIKYPRKSIIETGVNGITKYLRSEYILKEKYKESLIAEIDTPGRKPEQMPITNTATKSQPSMPVITLKSFHRMPRNRPRKSRSKNRRMYKSRSKFSIYRDTPYSNSNKYVQSSPVSRNDERVKDQIMRDMFLKKMQELLFAQEEQMQRNKDKEAIKNWRHSSKYKMKKPDSSYRPNVPFDYNEDYDRIPARKDIDRFMEKSRESLRSRSTYKPKRINVEKLITDIVESLKSMERERETEKTPRAQMDHAGREIKRILDLQKRLSALKLSNDRILL